MICKWCGGELLPTDVKCSRCRKDVPPLSDCGGFFDLMPSAKNFTDPISPATPQKTVTDQILVKREDKMVTKYKKRQKDNFGRLIYIVLSTVTVLTILLLLFVKVNRLSKKLEDFHNEIQEELERNSPGYIHDNESEIKISTSWEEENTEIAPIQGPEHTGNSASDSRREEDREGIVSCPTESVGSDSRETEITEFDFAQESETTEYSTNDPSAEENDLSAEHVVELLERENLFFDITLPEEEKNAMEVYLRPLGQLNDRVEVEPEYDETTGTHVCKIRVDETTVNAFALQVDRAHTNNTYLYSITYDRSNMILGENTSTPQYSWWYRIPGKEWEIFPERYVSTFPEKSNLILNLDTFLKQYYKDAPELTPIEVMCKIEQENRKGGKISLEIGGFEPSTVENMEVGSGL